MSRAARWLGLPETRIPNTFAYVALFSWPVICIGLFLWLPLELAAISSILGSYLLLPANLTVNPHFLPPLDRMSIASLSAFLLCWMKGAQAPTGRPPLLVWLLCIGFVISPLLTSLGNSYELRTPAGSIPGFYPLDAVKIAGRHVFELLPFFIGSRFLSNDEGRKLLVKCLPGAFVFYSLPMLFELRMSPQLHVWAYGYFPHEFSQQIRDNGFRPVVFVGHGLAVAFLTSLAVVGALICARANWSLIRIPGRLAAAYLAAILILCKSLGPMLYAFFLAPVVAFTKPRTWTKIACGCTLIVCSYPFIRAHNLVPVEHMSAAASAVSKDRDASLLTRLTNERLLLTKAEEKSLFGWGEWGRYRVRDATSGRDISITDGGWIIVFGTYGWFGYLSFFGLFALAAFSANRRMDGEVTDGSIAIGGSSLMLALFVFNELPNDVPMTIPLLLAGAVTALPQVSTKRRVTQPVSVGSRNFRAPYFPGHVRSSLDVRQ